jgi:hypothetical protein
MKAMSGCTKQICSICAVICMIPMSSGCVSIVQENWPYQTGRGMESI